MIYLIKTKNFLIVLFLVSLSGCQKDSTILIPEKRTVSTISPLVDWNSETEKPQTFTILADSWQTVTTVNGAQFVFAPRGLKSLNNRIVSGNVTLDIIEYSQPSQMLFSGKTMVSDEGLLESGNMFYITATQNGQPLRMIKDSGLIITLPRNNLEINEEMAFWHGKKNTKESLNAINWTKEDSINVVNEKDTFGRFTNNFTLAIDSFVFGYCNVARILFPTAGKVQRFIIKLPDGSADSNSIALMVFKNYNSAVWCNWLNTDREMTSIYEIPVGLSAKILVYRTTGKQINDLSYAIKEISFSSNTEIQFNEFTTCAKHELKELIKSLNP